MLRRSWRWLACAITGAMAAAMGHAVMAQADVLILTEPIEYHVQPLNLRTTRRGDAVYFIAEEAKTAQGDESEYWLGVQIAALPEVAKQQLGIDQGLVVEDVAPDSPAAKAEIKKHDILTKAGDTPL